MKGNRYILVLIVFLIFVPSLFAIKTLTVVTNGDTNLKKWLNLIKTL
jgi:hypothetical protein